MTEALTPPDAVAVVGMAGRFPGAATVADLGVALRATTDLTGEPTPGLADFPASHFGLSPDQARLIDPQHRLFLMESWRAVEDWGNAPGTQPGVLGVIGACSPPHYLHHRVLPETGSVPAHASADYLSLLTAYHLRATGPCLTTQAACAGGLVALAQACQALLDFRCDAVVAGGASVTLPEHAYDPALVSPDGSTNSFAAEAKGAGFSSGAAVFVLRRLEDALADGDRVHAVFRGAAVTNDGHRGAGFTSPSVAGQVEAISEALAVSEIDAADVDHIEGHGSGTPIGDAIEATALGEVFADRDRPLGLSSIKATLGHLDAAAGPASAAAAVLMVRDGYALRQPRFTGPMDALAETRLDVAGPDAEAAQAPRIVGVSSFGVGGTNVHLVIEQAPTTGDRAPADPTSWTTETCWVGEVP